MASFASLHVSRQRAPHLARLLAATFLIAAACAVLVALGPAVALAAKHGKTTWAPVASSEPSSTSSAPEGEATTATPETGSSSPASAAEASQPASAVRGHRGRATKHTAKSGSGEGGSETAAGGGARGGKGRSHGGRLGTTGNGRHRSGRGGGEATEAAGGGEQSTAGASPLARRKKGGTAKEKARKTISSASRQSRNLKESSAPPSVAVTPAATAATGASSTSTSAAPAAAKSVPPLVTAQHNQRAHKATRGTARRAASTTGTGPALAAIPGATALAGATTAARSSHAAAPAKHTHKPSSQPALERTITKIVGVVPTPVWIAMGVLMVLALAMALRSALTRRRAQRLERQRGQLLEDVGLLQAALLPAPPERLGPVATSVAYRPADGPGAGGDFYDVFALEDGQLAVIVGDVSGHGRGALPHTALLRFTVRAYLEAGLSPRQALQTAGTVLERQLGESFATVIAATYHPRERTLTYASAGHPPPVVIADPAAPSCAGASAIEPVTLASAPPVGAGTRTGTRQTVVSVPGPAQLCFYTDGVTEARVAGDLFGRERVTTTVAELGHEANAVRLLDAITAKTDARPDDMAACMLRVEGGAGLPAIVSELLELDRDSATGPRAERFLAAYGVPSGEVAAVMETVRERTDHFDTVKLELRFGEGAPAVSVLQDNVIHAAALAARSA